MEPLAHICIEGESQKGTAVRPAMGRPHRSYRAMSPCRWTDTREIFARNRTHERPMTEAPRYVSSPVGISRAAQPLELYVSSGQERQGIALITTTNFLAVLGKICSLCQSFAQWQI